MFLRYLWNIFLKNSIEKKNQPTQSANPIWAIQSSTYLNSGREICSDRKKDSIPNLGSEMLGFELQEKIQVNSNPQMNEPNVEYR